MPKRKFYIIGHNPNSIEEVKECLVKGVNAIEPDVSYHKDLHEKFYVHEDINLIPNFIEKLFWGNFPSLKEYLIGLKRLLFENPEYQLDLIVFDLKADYEYDINDLYKVIRENFSDLNPRIKIVTTISTPEYMNFLSALKDQKPNEFLGVDEHAEPEEVNNFFKDKGLRYVFAAGSSLMPTTTNLFKGRIKSAIEIRENNGFNMVYPWCVNSEAHMREYLDMESGIDAILTDEPERLKKLILSDDYSDKYTMDPEKPFPA
ncbi:hypothetical protein BH10BAC5_BH10BAC5_06930 [soil metagenome]